MKKFIFILCIFFVIMTIVGSVLVIASKGQINPGISCISMLFAIILSNIYKKM